MKINDFVTRNIPVSLEPSKISSKVIMEKYINVLKPRFIAHKVFNINCLKNQSFSIPLRVYRCEIAMSFGQTKINNLGSQGLSSEKKKIFFLR